MLQHTIHCTQYKYSVSTHVQCRYHSLKQLPSTTSFLIHVHFVHQLTYSTREISIRRIFHSWPSCNILNPQLVVSRAHRSRSTRHCRKSHSLVSIMRVLYSGFGICLNTVVKEDSFQLYCVARLDYNCYLKRIDIS